MARKPAKGPYLNRKGPKEEYPHPYIPELIDGYRKKDVSRREFLRTATLLGLSATAAYGIAGAIGGERGILPAAHAAETPKAGGTLRCAMQIQEMTDPATFDWVQKSNVARHIVEYLTETGPDNITRPYLCRKWEASDDLKTWTLHLHKGIKWSNGEDFNADDVVYNFKRWLDPKTGSSNIGLFSSMVEEVPTGKKDKNGKPVMTKRMSSGAIEKVDEHTVRLHLNSPTLAIPENLYNYPTAIVNRHFGEQGGDLSKNPVGTGPYVLEKFSVGNIAVLKRRPGKYWRGPIYLESIRYIDTGPEGSAAIAALASDQVDMVWGEFVSVNEIDVVKRIPNVRLYQVNSAQTGVARMQVDKKPFDDLRIRKALAACMDARKILDIAYRGLGEPGEDHHVAPVHPEYYRLEPMKRDIEYARRLLREAGHPNGLKLKIDVGNTSGVWEQNAMVALKQQLAPAGIDLSLNLMPAAQYWDLWEKTPFGFTSWTHRPLGVMVLNLAYRTGVPWNESHYANPDFDKALDVANGLLDLKARTAQMRQVEEILQGDAVIVQPLWKRMFSAANKRVHGYRVHPTYYHQFDKVWMS